MEKYRRATGDETVSVVVSTASPYKFCAAVLEAIGETPAHTGPELIAELESASGVPAPAPLKALLGKTARFTRSLDKTELKGEVRDFLK